MISPPVSFVTGANGFIGTHLTNALLASGHSVKILSRSERLSNTEWSDRDITIVPGDLCEPGEWQQQIRDCDFVFHCAGEVRDESRMSDLNVRATQLILDSCAGSSVKHITHLSSVGVIGSTVSGNVDESAPCHPFNAYEISKWEAENKVRAWCKTESIPVAMLRPTIVYGRNEKTSLILFWLKMIRRGLVFTVGKKAVANYVCVDDVVSACVVAANNKLHGEFIVANPLSLTEFLEQAAVALGTSPRIVGLPVPLVMGLSRCATSVLSVIGKKSPFAPETVKALAMETRYVADKLSEHSTWQPTDHVTSLKDLVQWYVEKEKL